ncbi:CAAX amino terminal protease family protein [Citrus sinensis]|uniref:CAAX amino terminal protease family protein n=1 Tax=Citrus sinensis TaxID=2711 RepID=A0ACB8LK40_CITSI|nr:CAAX amino terminal protease family protein [Citrus sinensis]
MPYPCLDKTVETVHSPHQYLQLFFPKKKKTMASPMIAALAQPCFYSFSTSQKLSKLKPNSNTRLTKTCYRRFSSICFYNAGKDSESGSTEDKETKLDWPVLKRWDVPWGWQTASLTSLACGFSFVLTGLVEAAALPYLGLKIEELSLDEKAEILFLDQGITTAVILGVLYGISITFKPLPEDLFCYDLREPFNLKKGWLLWAGIGLGGALLAVAATGAALSLFNGENPPEREHCLLGGHHRCLGSPSRGECISWIFYGVSD